MDYELFHDESKIKGYWHGALLVPINKKALLVDYLKEARRNTNYSSPLSLKDIRGSGSKHECARAWVSIGIAALMSRTRVTYPYQLYLGKRSRRYTEYSIFTESIKAKLLVFRNPDGFQNMSYVTEYGKRVEITFRIGLKGGIHFLGKDDEIINIEKMNFDGDEHYRRPLDRNRMIERVRESLRNYCFISTRQDLIDSRSSDHSIENSRDYNDCQLLQLTDLLIGSFREILSSTINRNHKKIVDLVRPLLERHFEGYARMQNSRWRNSLWMSQFSVVDGKWKFEPLEIEKEPEKDNQLSLPNFNFYEKQND